jgi:hypothetical protein
MALLDNLVQTPLIVARLSAYNQRAMKEKKQVSFCRQTERIQLC